MRRTLLSLLLGLGLVGCGSSAGPYQFAGGNTGSNQSAGPNTPPATSFSGRAVFRPIAVVEESQRALLVQNKSDVEIEGVLVSPDGKFVAWAPSPAAGWTAQLGTQSVLVDVDGSFAFQSPADGATEGILRHPSDSSIAYRFTTAQLGQAGGAPLVLPVFFAGPCGMQRGDGDGFCVPRPPVSLRSQVRPRLEGIEASTLRPAPRFFHDERQMKAGPLGSYPNPLIGGDDKDTKLKLETCPQTDGLLQRLGTDGAALTYFFSTCHDFVTTNACLNENAGSDIASLSGLDGRLLPFLNDQSVRTELVLLRIPNPNPEKKRNLHCYQNHKHRNCAQINLGDVVCKLPDNTLVRPTGLPLAVNSLLSLVAPEGLGFGTVEVTPGASQTITLHNNGAFGITRIEKLREDLKGDLSGDSLATRDGVPEIRHYLPLNYAPALGSEEDATAYVPDQVIKYTAPANAQAGQVDSYLFLVDDRYVFISFKAVALRPFLRRLGSTTEVTVQDLNEAGTMTTLRDDKTLLEPLGQDRIELLATPGGALLNEQGHCLYQASDHQSHAKLRFPDGQSTELVPPPGSLSTFADGVVSLSPQGFSFCRAKRADGKNDFYTTTQGGTVQYLGAPEGLSPSSEVTALTSTTSDALYANAPPGVAPDSSPFAGLSNAGKLVKFDFDTRQWSSTVVPPRADFLPAITSNYVDATASRVLVSTQGNNFSPAQPPNGTSWLNFFGFLIQSGAPFVIVHDSRIESATGSRTVIVTEQPIPADGFGSSHTTLAINEAGEAVGTLFRGGENRSVIFPVTGEPKDLVSLLPPASPPGTWTPLKMSGRFMVLQHTDGAGDSSVYLWFRGTE